ncbi:hypothetical protein BC834DRAFT_216068 [Gloeopeniophorella convolvens]|nr:hypothetical protein BC834DRAFT_216068 [Gloeopeniophorella convolvens]
MYLYALELPSDEQALAAGRELIESCTNWKKGKAYYKNTVHTYSKSKSDGDGATWHCRVSEHAAEDATFDEFWSKLGDNHAENEKEYIESVKKSTLVKKISDTQEIWTMYYEFTSIGVSPRVFTVLQTTHYDSSSPRTGLFICVPVDLSSDPELAKLEEKGTRGRYASVERFRELPGGKTEWRMATSSSPGGRIPAFVVDSTMGSQISADVPHFLKWFHTVRHETAEPKERPPIVSTASESNPIADLITAASVPTVPVAPATAIPGGAGAPVA